jgi:hypothetical protein
MRIGLGFGKRVLAAAAVALGVMAVAAPARAQSLVQFADIASQGGYVMSSDKATFYAEENAIGRVTRGWIVVERDFRSGGSIVMHGAMTRSETIALWNSIYNAAPWSAKQSVQAQTNTDFPNTVVTYVHRYTQTILGTPPATRVPRETAAMIAFCDQAWDLVQRTFAADLFVYHAAGSRSGYDREITISKSGAITDEVSYASAAFAGQGYSKQGQLTAAQVNALVAACASWSRYPKSYPGNPQMVDGIGITTTFTSGTVVKSVFAGDAANRPASYQAVIDMVEALGNQIP